MAIPNYRLPDPLKVTGSNVADNWERFREQWENYELAADLTDASSEKKAAIFLTCVGSEAYDVYRSMEFPSADDKKKIENIVEAFETFCVGAVNVTYERYMFHRRMQDVGERFDVYLGEIRRMARSCKFEGMLDSMIRDRIVVGIRDDSTRHKLLQIHDLTLKRAIDICKASEAAGRQLKAMATPDEVQALQPSKRRDRDKSQSRDTSRRRDSSTSKRCKYCDRQHDQRKEACPAYGKICRRCSKKHHFESVCRSAPVSSKASRAQVCELGVEEELLTLADSGTERWYTRMQVGDRNIRFLMDCGATVNLLPEALIRDLGRIHEIRPAESTLRMFDKSELSTSGMITVTLKHLRTAREYDLDFYVAKRHDQPLLGFKACHNATSYKHIQKALNKTVFTLTEHFENFLNKTFTRTNMLRISR